MSFLLAYRIDFSDGGDPEYQVLQRGVESAERCEEIAKRFLAVSYSGHRPVAEAHLVWGEE
jgi:hypothetical protein